MNQPLFFLQSKKNRGWRHGRQAGVVGERPRPSHFFTSGKKMARNWMRKAVLLQTRRP